MVGNIVINITETIIYILWKFQGICSVSIALNNICLYSLIEIVFQGYDMLFGHLIMVPSVFQSFVCVCAYMQQGWLHAKAGTKVTPMCVVVGHTHIQTNTSACTLSSPVYTRGSRGLAKRL
jgi:hypothetical protein